MHDGSAWRVTCRTLYLIDVVFALSTRCACAHVRYGVWREDWLKKFTLVLLRISCFDCCFSACVGILKCERQAVPPVVDRACAVYRAWRNACTPRASIVVVSLRSTPLVSLVPTSTLWAVSCSFAASNHTPDNGLANRRCVLIYQ